MKTTKALLRILAITAIAAMNSLLPPASAQPAILVPQPAPYTNDAYTLLLEHFDGTTGGSTYGAVGYTNGVFGQAVQLDNRNGDSWISWDFGEGGLCPATVEFWGKLDTLGGMSSWDAPTFIQSDDYSPFWHSTFLISVVTNYAYCKYKGPFDNWVGMTNWGYGSPITSNSWHHYAATWGELGFHFYVDGTLIYSTSDRYGQDPNTRFLGIGGRMSWDFYTPAGFAGVIDELRISRIQRTFTAFPTPYVPPTLNVRKAIYLDATNLWLETSYQLQASTDLATWTNVGTPFFTATNTVWRSPGYWDLDDRNSLFFRLQDVSP